MEPVGGFDDKDDDSVTSNDDGDGDGDGNLLMWFPFIALEYLHTRLFIFVIWLESSENDDNDDAKYYICDDDADNADDADDADEADDDAYDANDFTNPVIYLQHFVIWLQTSSRWVAPRHNLKTKHEMRKENIPIEPELSPVICKETPNPGRDKMRGQLILNSEGI